MVLAGFLLAIIIICVTTIISITATQRHNRQLSAQTHTQDMQQRAQRHAHSLEEKEHQTLVDRDRKEIRGWTKER